MRELPFHWTTELETKLVPFIVRVKLEPPAIVEVGEIEVVVGTGLFIVNVCAFDVPPPGVGLRTVTVDVPAVVISVVLIVAVS